MLKFITLSSSIQIKCFIKSALCEIRNRKILLRVIIKIVFILAFVITPLVWRKLINFVYCFIAKIITYIDVRLKLAAVAMACFTVDKFYVQLNLILHIGSQWVKYTYAP